MKTLSRIDRVEAQALLDVARTDQTMFWESLLELEAFLGVEISANVDLEDYTLDDLLKQGEGS